MSRLKGGGSRVPARPQDVSGVVFAASTALLGAALLASLRWRRPD